MTFGAHIRRTGDKAAGGVASTWRLIVNVGGYSRRRLLPKDGDFATCGRCKMELRFQSASLPTKYMESNNLEKRVEWE